MIKLSLFSWLNKQTDLKGQHSLYCFTVFICGGPCHLPSFIQCSGTLFSSDQLFTYFWVCIITPLIFEILKFWVWISPAELHVLVCCCLNEPEKRLSKQFLINSQLIDYSLQLTLTPGCIETVKLFLVPAGHQCGNFVSTTCEEFNLTSKYNRLSVWLPACLLPSLIAVSLSPRLPATRCSSLWPGHT